MSSKPGKPGTPSAFNIDCDSLTLTWTAPKVGKVKSYKILYRPTSEPGSDFKSLDNPIYATRHIKDLSHGVKYDFKVQAIGESDQKSEESDIFSCSTKEYYDIVLIGKTGQGKSTFGNTLLDVEKTQESNIRLFAFETAPATEAQKKKRFVQANDPEVIESSLQMLSVTPTCKLLANKNTNVRVLDVPGFSDSSTLKSETQDVSLSVYQGNLQIIRWVVRAQIQFQLKVRRIVYFLPVRGPLEKADGMLQEELKVLHHFFGKEVFDCVVMAATNPPGSKYQKIPFDKNDFDVTKHAFKAALKRAFSGGEDIACPPIIYCY